jgi:hypothetical protein
VYNSLENVNYYSDPRTIAQLAGSPLILGANKARQKLFLDPSIIQELPDLPKGPMHQILEGLEYVQFQGQEAIVINAPVHLSICPMCEGDGTVVDPKIDSSGWSREDLDQDPEFEAAYYAGAYDVECPNCKNKKLMATVNLNQVHEASELHIVLTAIKNAEKERYQLAQERANELKWGY